MPTRRELRQASKLLEQACALERGLDPLRAAEVFEQLAKLEPTNPECLARWSKQLSDASYVDGQTLQKIVELNTRAVELATRSMELQPNYSLGLVARCVSRGRLAVFTPDNKHKVQLAKDASDDAKLALQVDPGNDLAHHLMGRWHYEMAGLNFVVRTLIKLLFGTALMQGSYHEAVRFYSQAVQLAPARLVHRVELGRCLVKVGERQRAVEALESALPLEVEDLNAHLTRMDAERLLQELRASGTKSLWFAPQQPAQQGQLQQQSEEDEVAKKER